MIEAKKLALEKSKNLEIQDLWVKHITHVREALPVKEIKDRDLIILIDSCDSPEKLNLMSKIIYNYSKTHASNKKAINLLFKHVDDSIYTLKDWIDAIEVFCKHHFINDIKVNFIKMLGYIFCCNDFSEEKKFQQLLPELVKEMLDKYGYAT